MSAHHIASKFRRALRNGTGASFTQEQLRELGEYGVLRRLAEIEADELCPANDQFSQSATTGSTSGEMEREPMANTPAPAGQKLSSLKHPGRTAAQRRILDQIGCGNFCPSAKRKTLDAMVDAGLISRGPDRLLGRDAFGNITIAQYQMPIPVHMGWCSYWAEQPCEHGVADIEQCEACMAPAPTPTPCPQEPL